MGQGEDIIKDLDVFTHDGFEHAMQQVKHVPEGELHHLAAYSQSGGHYNATAELQGIAITEYVKQRFGKNAI